MKLKVCGMKHNAEEVASLSPDYLGFIFWEPSPRSFSGTIPVLPKTVQKVGVFVDASPEDILSKVELHDLNAVQLHGHETPEFCEKLKKALQEHARGRNTKESVAIIKVFSVRDTFDFGSLLPYEKTCDFFLFDTKGKLPGGNGFAFDWELLRGYPSSKPYFLSGGIGLEALPRLQEFLRQPEASKCHAIDVNSRFETAPGHKNIEDLKKFIKGLNL